MARRRFSRKARTSGRRYFGKSRRSGRRRVKTIPMAATAGAVVAGIAAWDNYQTYWKDKPFKDYLKRVPISILTGYDSATKDWSGDRMIAGKPLLAGIVVSAVAGKVPIVRSMPKKIPLVGKYLRW